MQSSPWWSERTACVQRRFLSFSPPCEVRASRAALIALMLVLGASSVARADIMSVTGPPHGAGLGIFSFQWEAISFTVSQPYADVTINVDLIGSFDGTAYLVNQIGSGTTVGNEIAHSLFTSTSGSGGAFQPVLQNVSLGGAGTYYVVLTTAVSNAPQGIMTTQAPVIVADSGVSNGIFYTANIQSTPAYAPAANFFAYSTTFGDFGEFTVVSNSPAPVPEPSSWSLAGTSALLVFALSRRKWRGQRMQTRE
jgi:hypothetical protein